MFDVFFMCMFGMLLMAIPNFYYTNKLKKILLANNESLFLYLEFDKRMSENSISKSLKFLSFILWRSKSFDLNLEAKTVLKKIRVISFIYSCIFVAYIIYFFDKN